MYLFVFDKLHWFEMMTSLRQVSMSRLPRKATKFRHHLREEEEDRRQKEVRRWWWRRRPFRQNRSASVLAWIVVKASSGQWRFLRSSSSQQMHFRPGWKMGEGDEFVGQFVGGISSVGLVLARAPPRQYSTSKRVKDCSGWSLPAQFRICTGKNAKVHVHPGMDKMYLDFRSCYTKRQESTSRRDQ